MSTFFLLNNLHFTFEMLGAVVFLAVAWLAFDAFLLRRDFLTASRGVGFLFLASWQILHAFSLTSEIWSYFAHAIYFLGALFVLWNMLLEKPVARPEFKAVLILPGFSLLLPYFNSVIFVITSFIAYSAYRQYRAELKKILFPFWVGFSFLAGGSLAKIFYDQDSLGILWLSGHLLELIGFGALAWWVWSYLQLRIREELLLIFIFFALFMSIIVSFTFSGILMNHIEAESRSNLETNTRVLDLAIVRLKEEALAKARLIAGRTDIKMALEKNDFAGLDKIMGKILVDEKLGFLTLVDKDGLVVLRAHALSKKDDDLSGDATVRKALEEGFSTVDFGTSPAEGFSVIAASPLKSAGKNAATGAVLAGFQLDNAFADDLKKVTGLNMSVYDGDTRVAATLFNPDGRQRSIGIRETNPEVLKRVFQEGTALTIRTNLFSRPFFASYLPLKNADMRIIGMISAEKPQKEMLEVAQDTNRTTLAVVMAIMLLLISPIYIITKRLSQEI